MKEICLLALALAIASSTISARDFDAVTPSGHTIYCDLAQGGAKIVGWDYSPEGDDPIHLTIPSTVSNGSATLRVVAIGDSAFMYCSRLVHVEIPSSIISVGRDSFNRCYGLGSIHIPSSVGSIGEDAFAFIPNVEYAGAAEGAPWGALYHNAYHEGQYYYADSHKTHIVCCERDAADASIPPTVTSIGPEAFYRCANITSVRIDSAVTVVGNGAFRCCGSLERVYYNPRITGFVEGYTFADCANLTQIDIGSSVAAIPLRFCLNCTSLSRIVIPDNVSEVDFEAFSGCTSLESAVVGEGVSTTAKSMFEGCASLSQVVLPKGLTEIAPYTFKGCRNLREVVLDDNVRHVRNEAFYGCGSLESLNWSRRLKVIGAKSFSGCSALTEIIIPSDVIQIGDQAFSGCGNVGRIVCMLEASPTMGSGIFDSIDSGIEVYVPCTRVELYRDDSQWQRFDSIEGKKYYLVVTSNNPRWGRAVVNRQPTCDDNTAVAEAIPSAGCRFAKWEDGNADNPRQIAYSGKGYAYRKAIFEPTEGLTTPEVPHTCLMPNPATEQVTVMSSFRIERVELYTLTGQRVMQQAVGGLSAQIDISSLPQGIYLVRTHTNRGIATKRLVVK